VLQGREVRSFLMTEQSQRREGGEQTGTQPLKKNFLFGHFVIEALEVEEL
jgi:hypothetical protein